MNVLTWADQFAVAAAMPKASEQAAMAVKPGFLRRPRNPAMYSVIYAVILDPLAHKDVDSLMSVRAGGRPARWTNVLH